MKREFTFLGEYTPEGLVQHDREEVRTALLDLEGALFQLGGVIAVASIREQVGENSYVTTGVRITYDSYAPVRERVSVETEIEPVED